MSRPEFDRFADNYKEIRRKAISPFGEKDDFFAEYKIKDVAQVAQENNCPRDLSILDFGAGVGSAVPFFLKYFSEARLTCLDVSQKSLDVARGEYQDAAEFLHFDGTHIPSPDHSFRLIFSACVFHHIPPDLHQAVLGEIFRVLEPGGIFITFEHNPHNPLTVRAVESCPLDDNAVLIKGEDLRDLLKRTGFTKDCLRYRLFFPHFLRYFRPLEQFLTWLPIGAQYYVYAQKPSRF